MTETNIAIDINNTSVEELCHVPGIGRAMAERVIANRPFNSIDDMTQVPGISERLLERIRPYLCVASPVGVELGPDEVAAALEKSKPEETGLQVEPEEPVDILLAPVPEATEAPEEAPAALELEPIEDASSSPITPLPAPQSEEPLPPPLDQIEPPSAGAVTGAVETLPPPVDAVPDLTSAAPPEPAATPAPAVERSASSNQSGPSRLEVLAYVLLGGFLALVLAVLISLGLLRAINGDLIYATASRFNGLQSQVGAMSGQISAAQSDIAGMRQRLDALETLSGRVSAIERDAQNLRVDLVAAENQILALQAQTEELAVQTELLAAQTEQLAVRTTELEQRTTIFQNFLDGLRDLLLGLTTADVK
jgi:competence ComEA-like helix-hairpin-helix protein